MDTTIGGEYIMDDKYSPNNWFPYNNQYRPITQELELLDAVDVIVNDMEEFPYIKSLLDKILTK